MARTLSDISAKAPLRTSAERRALREDNPITQPAPRPRWSAGTNVRSIGGGIGGGTSSSSLSAMRGAVVNPEDMVQQAAVNAALQATNAKSSLLRQLQRYGVNPASQRAIAGMGKLGMQEALNKTTAMTGARLGAEGQQFGQLAQIAGAERAERGLGLSERQQGFREQQALEDQRRSDEALEFEREDMRRAEEIERQGLLEELTGGTPKQAAVNQTPTKARKRNAFDPMSEKEKFSKYVKSQKPKKKSRALASNMGAGLNPGSRGFGFGA